MAQIGGANKCVAGACRKAITGVALENKPSAMRKRSISAWAMRG